MTKTEFVGLFIAFGVAVWSTLMAVPPVSWWLVVDHITVNDGVAGQPITMDVDRTINRTFEGEWRVEVRRMERGAWESYCTTSTKRQTYEADAALPDPVTLEWWAWTEPRCYSLPEGTYRITTVWTINPGRMVERDLSFTTEPFIIRGKPDA